MARQRFGNITPLPSGRFRARVTVAGVPYSDVFDTTGEANDWLSEILATKRHLSKGGDWRTTDRGKTAFRDFAMAWFAGRTERGELAPRTVALYADLLENELLPAFGDRPLAMIAPEDIAAWHGRMSRGPTRQRQAYSVMSAIMNAAVRESRIATTPCLLRGARSTKKKKVVVASPDEAEALANLVPKRYRILVLLGTWSGLRFSELCELRRCDVTLDPPAVRVRGTVHRVAGVWVQSGAKSEAGFRTVHLPPSMAADLEEHLDSFVGPDPDARLICTRTGNPLARSNWSATFGRARRKIDRDDLDFHDLRHTQATISAQAGATLAELMQRMGHSTPNAAMIYQHADADRDQAIAKRLDAVRPPRDTSSRHPKGSSKSA